jgi:hypothetical protein
MRLLRARLTGQFCSLPRALPTRKMFQKNNKDVELKTPTPSKFIANSSPSGNNADLHAHLCALRERQTRREAGAQSLRASYLAGRR